MELTQLSTLQVQHKSTLPIWSIALTAVLAVLLSLIALGSAVAFNDVVSLSISGLYTSYLIGNSLLLYRRMKGDVKPYSDAAPGALRNTTDSEILTWGVWRIPEPLGTVVNAFSCAYLLLMLVFSFWPTIASPTAAEMNYSSLMMGAVAIFSIFYYLTIGHRTYRGPIVEIIPN